MYVLHLALPSLSPRHTKFLSTILLFKIDSLGILLSHWWHIPGSFWIGSFIWWFTFAFWLNTSHHFIESSPGWATYLKWYWYHWACICMYGFQNPVALGSLTDIWIQDILSIVCHSSVATIACGCICNHWIPFVRSCRKWLALHFWDIDQLIFILDSTDVLRCAIIWVCNFSHTYLTLEHWRGHFRHRWWLWSKCVCTFDNYFCFNVEIRYAWVL